METDKKQEFKDFSLTKDILINELSEDEILKLFPSPKTQKTETKDEAVICERFVDAAIELSQRGRTENNAATYVTSDDPRIDFFFKVLEDTNDHITVSLLERSWNFNCLDTLRLIAYLRDIRSGKSIRYQYYVCLYWMYKHHPLTLMQNIKILLNCGYWKDLLQLLMVILFKGKISSYLFQEEFKSNSRSVRNKSIVKSKKTIDNKLKSTSTDDKSKLDKKVIRQTKGEFYKTMKGEFNQNLVDYYKDEINKKYKPLTIKTTPVMQSRFRRSRKSSDSIEIRERTANEVDKKYLDELRLRYARERFNNDKKYRYFHLKFAELFAKQLIDDLKNLNENKLNKLSLAGKWAPSLAGHFDKYTLIASSVALQLAKLTRNQDSVTEKVAKLTIDQKSVGLQLTKEQDSNIEEIFTKPIPIATYLARKHYHKNYLVKLREKLKIPETFMCNRQWNILPYDRVPSKCMQKNRKSFKEHDSDRFEQFVKSKEKISGATLKPPELVQRAMNLRTHDDDDIEKELVEKQWNSLKDSIKLDNKESCFKSAVSVCDVSGSMSGTPMLAAIGLTIMTMSFTDEPWSNLCLTFSESPKFVHFEKNLSFNKKVERILNGGWGYNTNLTKTFELIIEVAKKNELKQSEMPKFLFIFTDMEFDCACKPEETNFEEAKRLFKEAGYELPTIVFWNLRDTKSVPIQKDENGTILLSGYSAQQLSLLLNLNVENITPFAFIEDILKIKKYEDLVVID